MISLNLETFVLTEKLLIIKIDNFSWVSLLTFYILKYTKERRDNFKSLFDEVLLCLENSLDSHAEWIPDLKVEIFEFLIFDFPSHILSCHTKDIVIM